MDDLFELQTDGLIWLYCDTNLLQQYENRISAKSKADFVPDFKRKNLGRSS